MTLKGKLNLVRISTYYGNAYICLSALSPFRTLPTFPNIASQGRVTMTITEAVGNVLGMGDKACELLPSLTLYHEQIEATVSHGITLR